MKKAEEIAQAIEGNVEELKNQPNFVDWVVKQPAEKGDIILINNSFVFREDVKTNKSNLFLALKFLEKQKIDKRTYVVKSSKSFNADFKLIKNQKNNEVQLQNVKDVIKTQIQLLGDLVFILIGEIDDSIITEVPIQHGIFRKLVWNPLLETIAIIDNDSVIVQDTYDEEKIWITIFPDLKKSFDEKNLSELRKKLGIGLDKLQDKAVARLRIPTVKQINNSCITCTIVDVLKKQRNEYKNAINRYTQAKTPSELAMNDVLRIAYNFASDATTFLRLIVSICDLKPILLWGTVTQHYALSKSFNELTWFRSNNKPSLKNYISIVGDARNSAFHNLFPFRKSLEVSLPTSALRDAQLVIFSEFEKKKQNELKFQDKELVDVLFEFTRARARQVPIQFWKQNLEVMNKTIDLFEITTQFLWRLI